MVWFNFVWYDLLGIRIAVALDNPTIKAGNNLYHETQSKVLVFNQCDIVEHWNTNFFTAEKRGFVVSQLRIFEVFYLCLSDLTLLYFSIFLKHSTAYFLCLR